MDIIFKESISKLRGKIFTTTFEKDGINTKISIMPDMFCREWFEITLMSEGKSEVIARYISSLDIAKEIVFLKIKDSL